MSSYPAMDGGVTVEGCDIDPDNHFDWSFGYGGQFLLVAG